jgi:hypothetical protein
VLLNFVAITAARVPRLRTFLNRLTDWSLKDEARRTFGGDAGWEKLRAAVEAAGGTTEGLSPEAFDRFLMNDDYTIELSQTSNVQIMVESVGTILETLIRRRWALWPLRDEAPDLICSDFSVSVTSVSVGTSDHVGFGTPGTVLVLPLHRRVLLVGVMGGTPKSSFMDRRDVAGVNSQTLLHANQAYSSAAEFVWLRRSGEVSTSDELLAALRPKES